MMEAKRFRSPAGVERVVGSKVQKDVHEFADEAKLRVKGETRETDFPTESAEVATGKLQEYLRERGIGEDVIKKFDGINIGRADGISSIFSRNAWFAENETVVLEPDAPVSVAGHELAHASSRNTHFLGNSGRETRRSGFHIDTAKMENGERKETFLDSFNFLNETVTDELAVRATGEDHGQHIEKRKLLNTLFDSIAKAEKSTGQPLDSQEKVWKEFLQSYFYAWTPNLKRALRESFSPEVLKILALIENDYLALDISDFQLPHSRQLFLETHDLVVLTDNITRYFSHAEEDLTKLGQTILPTLAKLRAQGVQ